MKIVQSVLRIAMLCFIACSVLPAMAANPRYVISGDEVYDKKTDLTWKRCSVGMRWKDGAGCVGIAKLFTFKEAQTQAGNGWRVPNKAELTSIIDQKRKDAKKAPTIDTDAFPDLAEADSSMHSYWTSTPTGSPACYVWRVRFADGSVDEYGACSDSYAVRLVRGGQ